MDGRVWEAAKGTIFNFLLKFWGFQQHKKVWSQAGKAASERTEISGEMWCKIVLCGFIWGRLDRRVGNPLNSRCSGAFLTKILLLSPAGAPFWPALSICAKPWLWTSRTWACPAPNTCRDPKLCHRKEKVGEFSKFTPSHPSKIPSLFPGSHLAAQGWEGTALHLCKLWSCLQKTPKMALKWWFPACSPSLEHRGGGVAAAYRCSLKTSMWVFAKGAFFFLIFYFLPCSWNNWLFFIFTQSLRKQMKNSSWGVAKY